jgi:hypothetical protein
MSERKWGSHSNRPLTVTAAKKRGVIRLDLSVLTNPQVEQLSDGEFRAYLTLLPWVARYSDSDGEFPREWLETFAYGRTEKGRARRINEKLLARLVESGLVEVFEYDDDTQTIAVVGWRDFRPVDPTSAERKRRHRRRLYGPAYYGTEGEVQEVQLPSADAEEISATEAEGHALRDEVESRGVAVVRGEADPTPSQRT